MHTNTHTHTHTHTHLSLQGRDKSMAFTKPPQAILPACIGPADDFANVSIMQAPDGHYEMHGLSPSGCPYLLRVLADSFIYFYFSN